MNETPGLRAVDALPEEPDTHRTREGAQSANARALLRSVREAGWARWQLRHADLVGDRVRLRGRPAVSNWGRLMIGDRVQLVSTVATLELVTMPGGTLDIRERAFINYGCQIAASNLIRIGRRCLLGTHVMLTDNGFHRLEPERRLERPASAPVVLEDNVWLGARVIVLPGVTVGRDSAVAAGSIVTRDIPSRALAAGIPARVVRNL